MDSSPTNSAEGRLGSLLIAFDEARRDGRDYDASVEAELPGPLREELREIQRCIRLLRGDAATSKETVATRDDPTPALPAGDGSRPPPPARLGRFEIRRQLGAGGGGLVFLAFDP